MQKIELPVGKINELKKKLEEEVTEHNKEINRLNSIVYKSNESFSIKEIQKIKERKSQQLIKLHVSLLAANLLKGEKEEKCNAENIKRLSEIKRELLFLDNLISNEDENRISNKMIKEEKSKLINEEMKIKESLSKFNKQVSFEVEIDHSIININ